MIMQRAKQGETNPLIGDLTQFIVAGTPAPEPQTTAVDNCASGKPWLRSACAAESTNASDPAR